MYKNQGLFRPIDELNLKMEDNNSTINKYEDSINRLRMSKSSGNLKTIKEYNDRIRENSGVKKFHQKYNQIDLANVCSKEYYYKINRMKQPDSNRILKPDLIPKEEFVPSKKYNSSNKLYNSGSFLNLINKTDKEEIITKCRKVPNPKVYKSFNIMQDDFKAEPYKKRLGNAIYKKYDYTTQITTIPGGLKRDKYSIKDDQKFYNKKNQGHFVKIMRDYTSNIHCIPNSQTKIPYYDLKLKTENLGKNKSDIINTNISINSFKTSYKTEVDRAFGIPTLHTHTSQNFLTKSAVKNLKHLQSQIVLN